MFITFEGGEGCGKSTHSKLLRKYLEDKGFKVVLTFEPGGTAIGKKLRQMLLRNNKIVSRFSELFLFAADRAEHVASVIKPSLKAGKIVICDRYIDSTTAYQMGGRKLPERIVRQINDISSGGVRPDITFLLDIDPSIGISRGTKNTKKDKFESLDRMFHERIRRVYHKTAKREPGRIKVISSLLSINDVQSRIRRILNEKL